jgi:hypothetical protein
MYKVEIYAPESALEDIRKVLLEMDAGRLGNYKGCLSYYPVTGVWFSGENTNPTIGSPGEWSRESEIKIEVNVQNANVEKTVEAIRKVHPYEEPLINVIQLSRLQ